MGFSAKDVMALRQKTGIGMMDCKKALEKNDGNMDAAETWLREQRKGKMDTRTERTTAEGLLGIAIEDSNAVLVEVQTESDFTARNEAFVKMVQDVTQSALAFPAGPVTPDDAMTKRIDDLRITTGENVNFARGEKLEGGSFGSYVHHDGKRACLLQVEGAADDDLLKGICQHIVVNDPLGIDESDIPDEKIQQIRADALKDAADAGKPEEIAQKIADGKVRKYLEQKALLHQKYVRDDTKAVRDVLPEGVRIRRFVRYTLGQN